MKKKLASSVLKVVPKCSHQKGRSHIIKEDVSGEAVKRFQWGCVTLWHGHKVDTRFKYFSNLMIGWDVFGF